MSLQHFSQLSVSRRSRHIYVGLGTISGAAGSQIINSSSNSTLIVDRAVGTTSSAEAPVVYAVYSASHAYSQEMIDHILQQDREQPEAKFDNVISMLDWLES